LIVVDSSVWIDHLRGRLIREVENLREYAALDMLMLGDLVMGEVLCGLRNENATARVEKLLRRFTVARMLDASPASFAAANYRKLCAVGITINKTDDLIIGTYCIANRHVLFHGDKDFLPMSRHLGPRSLLPLPH
jgi:predicted nucleic acid-binding protein